MLEIGDVVVYSSHGLCRINDICEKSFSGTTNTYYELQPLENHQQLTINVPITNDKLTILELMQTDEANELLESFSHMGLEWTDKANIRYKEFSELIHSGDRNNIALVINTLMRKSQEIGLDQKKLGEQDRKLLEQTQSILFKELAFSLHISNDEVKARVNELIQGN